MAKQREPRIVAELGRPETPEETAARKAENSRLHSQRQTVNNLVYSLLASLGLVLLIVLIVPRGVGDFDKRNVDVASLAADATASAGQTLAAPNMPEGWLAKQAQLRHSQTDNVTNWYIGYTTPEVEYAAVMQAFTAAGEPANETWVADQLERKHATGVTSIAGLEWTVYDHTNESGDETNVRYGLTTLVDEATIIVFGTADEPVITALAEATIASLQPLSPDGTAAGES